MFDCLTSVLEIFNAMLREGTCVVSALRGLLASVVERAYAIKNVGYSNLNGLVRPLLAAIKDEGLKRLP